MTKKKIRFRGGVFNPNHHLWNNNGTWFIHYTIHPTKITKERVRRSLSTKDVVEARQRRDKLLRRLVNTGQPAYRPAMLLAA